MLPKTARHFVETFVETDEFSISVNMTLFVHAYVVLAG